MLYGSGLNIASKKSDVIFKYGVPCNVGILKWVLVYLVPNIIFVNDAVQTI